MIDKEYNTHLVKLWLDNDEANYKAQQSMPKATLNSDQKLMSFLKARNYGMDRSKIDLNKNNLNMKDIRDTIKDNRM